jgi:hypothetical protein
MLLWLFVLIAGASPQPPVAQASDRSRRGTSRARGARPTDCRRTPSRRSPRRATANSGSARSAASSASTRLTVFNPEHAGTGQRTHHHDPGGSEGRAVDRHRGGLRNTRAMVHDPTPTRAGQLARSQVRAQRQSADRRPGGQRCVSSRRSSSRQMRVVRITVNEQSLTRGSLRRSSPVNSATPQLPTPNQRPSQLPKRPR